MTDMREKAHLGVGWSFPLRPVNGRLRYARYEEDIEQAIQIILLTAQGERVMLRQFGAGLRDLVFEPNAPATWARIEDAVRRALVDWEPRIDLERVEVTAGSNPDLDLGGPGGPDLRRATNVVLIHVDYVVRATNSAYSRVYPFYLLEGSL